MMHRTLAMALGTVVLLAACTPAAKDPLPANPLQALAPNVSPYLQVRTRPTVASKPLADVAALSGQTVETDDFALVVPAEWIQRQGSTSTATNTTLVAYGSDLRDADAGYAEVSVIDIKPSLTPDQLLDLAFSLMTSTATLTNVLEQDGQPIGFAALRKRTAPFPNMNGFHFIYPKGSKAYLLQIEADPAKFSDDKAMAVAKSFRLK
jgi:hypothetical protein